MKANKRVKPMNGVYLSDAIREGTYDDWLSQLGTALSTRREAINESAVTSGSQLQNLEVAV